MYEDLNQIAQLKLNKAIESISKETREKVTEMRQEYAALSGSYGRRSGQHEASVGRVQIDGAEQLVRALYQTWVNLITQRKGHVSRPDIAFIAGKVDGYAQTQKGHLHKAFSSQRMGAVINVLTQEAERQMHAVAADIRRDLEIMVREHEAFPKDVAAKQGTVANMDAQIPKRITRQFANILNVLVASPSDVNEERDVVTQSIHDWNAAHFASTGIMLNPVRWESHSYPASGHRPQAIVNKQIVESGDILIGLFGYKLGTPTGAAQSGTIEEIEEFRKAGKYVALYFSTADVPRNADRDQLESLEAYKKERQKDTLYFDFKDSRTLRDHLTAHLPKIVEYVREQLEGSRPGREMNSESVGTSAGSATERAATQSWTMIADIISEVEDNLDRAERPRTGDVYRRPSNKVWLDNRNRVTLPPDVRAQLKNVYHDIDAWLDIVNSGLNPNLGSNQLDLIVSGLRPILSSLISQMRELKTSSPGNVKTGSDEGAVKSSDWERMADKLAQSCRFLRADSQWTSDTRREVWRIAGGNGGMCEALLQQAGAMLLKSPKVRVHLSQEVLSESDGLNRWLLYLKQRGFHEVSFPAYEEQEDGTKITHLMGGIKDLPENSAQVCIQCAALET